MPFSVSLTGGIGSGKTTVANLFAKLGVDIVDTDAIAHSLTGAGQPAVEEISKQFGAQYLAASGALDRNRMRQLVFANPQARRKLEAILHPGIRLESERLIAAAGGPYVIVVVPLLFETGAHRSTARRVLVVDCDPETQIRRVMQRSGLSRQDALAIMASQASREQRLQGADDVIHNDDGLGALEAQVETLHRKYLALAANG